MPQGNQYHTSKANGRTVNLQGGGDVPPPGQGYDPNQPPIETPTHPGEPVAPEPQPDPPPPEEGGPEVKPGFGGGGRLGVPGGGARVSWPGAGGWGPDTWVAGAGEGGSLYGGGRWEIPYWPGGFATLGGQLTGDPDEGSGLGRYHPHPRGGFGGSIPGFGGAEWMVQTIPDTTGLEDYTTYGEVSIPFQEGGEVNTDTVPAMLTPGEFVVKKDSVDEFGMDRLEDINDDGQLNQSVQGYQHGGPVGQGWGPVGPPFVPNPQIPPGAVPPPPRGGGVMMPEYAPDIPGGESGGGFPWGRMVQSPWRFQNGGPVTGGQEPANPPAPAPPPPGPGVGTGGTGAPGGGEAEAPGGGDTYGPP